MGTHGHPTRGKSSRWLGDAVLHETGEPLQFLPPLPWWLVALITDLIDFAGGQECRQWEEPLSGSQAPIQPDDTQVATHLELGIARFIG